MSGRTKRILYILYVSVVYLGAVGCCVALYFLGSDTSMQILMYFLGMVAVVIGLPVLFHETGHLCAGLLVGMRPHSFSVGMLRIAAGKISFRPSNVAGETQMYPVRAGRMRTRAVVYTLGGALLDLIVGTVLVAVAFTVRHVVMICFGMIGAFSLAEGLIALFPAETAAGKTDGRVLLGLIKKDPEEEVLLHVWEAQGHLYRGSFGEIPQEVLFQAPVVRGDLPAYGALLLLEAQAHLDAGREEEAKRVLERLLVLSEESGGEAQAEAKRYLGWFSGEFRAETVPLRGVRELEERLEAAAPERSEGEEGDGAAEAHEGTEPPADAEGKNIFCPDSEQN